jgi:CYTH domain-containing protein
MTMALSFKELLIQHGVSLEEINGRKSNEIEFTLYAEMTDMSQLSRAISKEKHEQWNIPLDGKPDVRARLRLIDDRRHTMTTKLRREGVTGWEEVDSDISKDMFDHLRAACIVGHIKTRYTFLIPNSELRWEIDVYMGGGGEQSCWVKIDLEVPNLQVNIPHLPVDVAQIIVADSPKLTARERAKINRLWEGEWVEIDRPSNVTVDPLTSLK